MMRQSLPSLGLSDIGQNFAHEPQESTLSLKLPEEVSMVHIEQVDE